MVERINQQEIPYIPFPDKPEEMNVRGYTVYKYIDPPVMDSYIKALSERVNLRDYDEVLVNLWGGLELFHDLATIQRYLSAPYLIRYTRTDSGSGVAEIIPVHPSFKNKKVLLVEDILDRGWTIQEIMKQLGPGSRAAVAVTKKGIKGQILDGRVDTAAFIDDVWVAGKGMDASLEGEGELFRRYRGIVGVPQK